MAALSVLEQKITDLGSGLHLVASKVTMAGGSDTVSLPEGLNNVAHVAIVPVDSSDTAASADSITRNAHPQGATLNVSGATSSSDQWIFSLHSGNTAGL